MNRWMPHTLKHVEAIRLLPAVTLAVAAGS